MTVTVGGREAASTLFSQLCDTLQRYVHEFVVVAMALSTSSKIAPVMGIITASMVRISKIPSVKMK